MTQVMADEVGLEEALGFARLVAVVRAAEPASAVRQVPIGRPATDGGVAPPYELHLQRLVVEEVLFAAPGESVAAGTLLEVARADWETMLEGHIAYHCDGLGESPIVPTYVGSCPPDAERFIAFLSRDRRGMRYAIDGGREALELRSEVEALLSRRDASREGVLAVEEGGGVLAVEEDG